MPTKAPKVLLSKSYFKSLASAPDNVNPDELARVLTRPLTHSSKALKSGIWKLLQDLASTATLRRASKIISHSRSRAELQELLPAVIADRWLECAPALTTRIEAETRRLSRRVPSRDVQTTLALLCDAATVTRADASAAALSKLLACGSALVRCAAARYALALNRADALGALVPLAFENSPAAALGETAIGRFGDVNTVAMLWTRALAARKRGHRAMLFRDVRMLAALKAVDILVALRCWIEEDFAISEELGWPFAESWCALVLARAASGDCSRDEALHELRWLLHVAEGASMEARLEHEGVFHLAAALLKLGQTAEAERLALRVAARSLPPPDQFPTLVPLVFKHAPGPKPTAWLAAAGERSAQEKLVENWVPHLRAGRTPIDWAMRDAINPELLRDVLTTALDTEQPLVLRRVLKLLCGTASAALVRDRLETLATQAASEVVRWKARRVLDELALAEATVSTSAAAPVKLLRLDAAVLTGASRIVKPPDVVKVAAPRTGLKPPARAGRGWTLDFETLKAPARRDTVKALLRAPLNQSLERRAPFGPSYEQRPDVRAVRETATPHSAIDEQMAEMAQAVMINWIYSDEVLTLDIGGAAQLAGFLATPGVTMDDDDLLACGAFMGETLRKRFGGEWHGFDGEYQLIVGGQSFDPLGLARDLMAQKDPMKACMQAAELLERARQTVAGKEADKPARPPRDTAESFSRLLNGLCEKPIGTPMLELLAEVRIFTYRMDPSDWASVLTSCDFLLENASGARIVAALCAYAPGSVLGRLWAHWGAKLRESSGLTVALVEALRVVAERDDLEALPDWTFQPPVPRMSFLNTLRKRLNAAEWRKVLMLLVRQRASAGDVAGVGWCLFSYKFEHADALPLVKTFCDMTVSARQTILRSTRHCTRDELSLFRPLWAEGLRDPSAPVAAAALDAVGINRARSLRFLVEALKTDPREGIGALAQSVVESF